MCGIIRGEDPLCYHVETLTQSSESCGSLRPAGLKMTDSCRINRATRGHNGPSDWPYAELPQESKPRHRLAAWKNDSAVNVPQSVVRIPLEIAAVKVA